MDGVFFVYHIHCVVGVILWNRFPFDIPNLNDLFDPILHDLKCQYFLFERISRHTSFTYVHKSGLGSITLAISECEHFRKMLVNRY